MSTALSQRPQLKHLSVQLDDLKQRGTYFKLRVLDDVQGPVCTYDGKKVINLASNNYLGLCDHPKLREAAIDATKKFGVGSGAVRTIAGTMKIHMDLEEKIARFKNVEACVVFQSGFTANAGTVSSILGKEDFIISDELNHASIIDGARLSRAKIKVYRVYPNLEQVHTIATKEAATFAAVSHYSILQMHQKVFGVNVSRRMTTSACSGWLWTGRPGGPSEGSQKRT